MTRQTKKPRLARGSPFCTLTDKILPRTIVQMQAVCEYIVPTSDSDAYSAGMAAGLDPEFVPCPYEPESRASQLWHSGRSDILFASMRTDMAMLDDGD